MKHPRHNKDSIRLLGLFLLAPLLCLAFAQAKADSLPEPIMRLEKNKTEAMNALPTEINSVPAVSSAWQLIQKNLQLKPATHAAALGLVKKYEAWYGEHPAYTKRMLERSTKYLAYVVNEVNKRKMPSEIALLPMIESAYNPMAKSSKEAVGIWQFIPGTGRDFGLEQNDWVDQRKGVVQSTQAALNYLERLYGQFGSWELALAAYNAGEGRILKAIAANKKLGKPVDYYNLTLNLETREYVPKLLAIKTILQAPEKYQLTLPKIGMENYFQEVTLTQAVDADIIPSLAGISEEEFKMLNAEHKMPLLTPEGSAKKVLLPIRSTETFRLALANATQPLANWLIYKLNEGETARTIAERFNLDLAALKKLNHLTEYAPLTSNMTLLVPKDPRRLAYYIAQQNGEQRSGAITHHISPGDNLRSIARKYKVSTEALMAFNELRSEKLIIGTAIDIPK